MASLSSGAWADDIATTKAALSQQNQKSAEVHARIGSYDDQINAIQNQIDTAQQQIAQTQDAIDQTNQTLDGQVKTLQAYLKAEFMADQTSPLEVLAESGSFSSYVDTQQYLQSASNKVNEAVIAINTTKQQLQDQEAHLKHWQNELASAQNGLNFQRAQAAGELAGIDAARAQLRAKLASLRGGGMPAVGEAVEQGEIVGYEGTSGCSTGPHLHFEVQINGTPVNPRTMAPSRLAWPLDSGWTVSQEFGQPDWNAPYSFHSGLDMSKYFGAPVYAAASGRVIFSGYDHSGFGDHVILDNGNGIHTIYGHMGARPSDYPHC